MLILQVSDPLHVYLEVIISGRRREVGSEEGYSSGSSGFVEGVLTLHGGLFSALDQELVQKGETPLWGCSFRRRKQ